MKKVLKPFKFGTMKTAADFEKTMTEAGLPFPVDENVDILAKPIQIGDKIVPNRLCIQPLAGQEQALGRVQAQACHIAFQPLLIEMQPQTCRRHEHFRAAGAQAKVAGQCHVGGTTINTTMQRSNGDGAALLDGIDHLAKAAAFMLAVLDI